MTRGRSLGAISILLMSMVVFSALLNPDAVLFSTDNNIGNEQLSRSHLPAGFHGFWDSSPWLGGGGVQGINLTALELWLLPLQVYMNSAHALDLVLASLLLVVFLRRVGVSWLACAGGWLAAFWLGSHLTLTYAGHTGKFGLLVFAAAALVCVQRAAQTRKTAWAILAGGSVGGMLLEQQDVAVFVGMVIAAYAVFAIVRQEDWNIRVLAGRLIAMGAVAVVVAGGSIVAVYTANVSNAAPAKEEDPHAQWEFCTQWSQPADETIDFVAPGYTGWRSGEPEGPYWGRMGQSAGWEQTRQGFMNFKLDNVYVGAIPVCFALFAVAAALLCRRGQESRGGPRTTDHRPQTADSGRETGKGESGTTERQNDRAAGLQNSRTAEQKSGGVSERQSSRTARQASGGTASTPSTINHQPLLPSDRRAEILFWAAAAAITLMLAWGKSFPLYALFYKLPFVSSIRNPNKFLHAFQIALGILAAYGVDIALKWRQRARDYRTE